MIAPSGCVKSIFDIRLGNVTSSLRCSWAAGKCSITLSCSKAEIYACQVAGYYMWSIYGILYRLFNKLTLPQKRHSRFVHMWKVIVDDPTPLRPTSKWSSARVERTPKRSSSVYSSSGRQASSSARRDFFYVAQKWSNFTQGGLCHAKKIPSSARWRSMALDGCSTSIRSTSARGSLDPSARPLARWPQWCTMNILLVGSNQEWLKK